MKSNIGLWIDHRKAVIIVVSDAGQEIKGIPSHMDRQLGRSDGERFMHPSESLAVPADDTTNRTFAHHINTFYDKVIACVHEAELLLILGPGEAKSELRTRLEKWKPSSRIVTVEAAGKMTDPQVAAKVRDHFTEESPVLEVS